MLETIVAIYEQTMRQHRDRLGFRYKADGTWHDITYGEMDRRVTAMASALIELGVRPGDRVALLSENRPEWVQSDLAILRAGAVNVPIYMTLTAKQLAYILNDCRPQVVVASTQAQLLKVLEACREADSVRHVIVMDGPAAPQDGLTVTTLKDFLETGTGLLSEHRTELAMRERGIEPQSVVSIIYTSGTTGNPKGVMLSHRNFATNASTVCDLIDLHSTDSCLSFLPLSHVLERVAYYAFLHQGALINYAESIDMVATNLQEVRPTFLVSVPRLFEKIRAKVFESVDSGPALKQTLFYWGLEMGRRVYEAKASGREPDFFTQLQYNLADRLVFSKVRERTGGNLRYCISGGAPLPKEVGIFFDVIGITILEGYGLTESSPVIACNRPGHIRLGTVGMPIPHVEVRLAEDGEILARGPNIMLGYFNNEEATREALDPDGWLHTGDIGALEDGYLRITDRKKEILVMSNGKNVAPQPIESALVLSSLIAQAMVIGDNRNYVTALVVPNFETLERVARERGWTASSPRELVARPEVKELLRQEIDTQTKDFARFEQIKEFLLLPEEFTQENDELTPTLKLKRRNVLKRYQDAIDALYEQSAAPVS